MSKDNADRIWKRGFITGIVVASIWWITSVYILLSIK